MDQLFVRNVTGQTLTIDVDLQHDNVYDLSKRILNYEGIAPEYQMLTHSGKLLQYNNSLKHYNIQPFDTIDLSLKLLSSTTKITVKMEKSLTVEDMKIPPEQTLEFNPRTTLGDIRAKSRVPSNTAFVHNNKVLKNEAITIGHIDNIWDDLTLHTAMDGVDFLEARYLSFQLFGRKSNPIYLDSKLRQKRIYSLICDFFRSISFDPKFCSEGFPFKAITIRFGKYKYELLLNYNIHYDTSSDHYIIERLDKSSSFGCIFADCTNLHDLSKFFSNCDCCTRSETKISEQRAPRQTIIIEIELPDQPFIFQEKWYYANGKFYHRQRQKPQNFIDLQLFPVIGNKNEELLFYGYMRSVVDTNDYVFPTEIASLINRFYPCLYGGRYDVDKHNNNLMNELTQKTNEFTINDIDFYLMYGQMQDENAQQIDDGNNDYFLVLNLENQKNVTVLYILCTVHCKNTLQSYTFIEWIDFSDESITKHHRPLPDFGHKTSLSSLVCDVQIINMLSTSDWVYEYPSTLTRNAYLLEWKIDGKLLQNIKNGIKDGLQQSYESDIFYNLFRLRCYPNRSGSFYLAIQLISLPVNRIHKDEYDELILHCRVYEKKLENKCEFYAGMDYDDTSAFCAKLPSFDPYHGNYDDMHFKVLIEIMNPKKLPLDFHNVMDSQTANHHRGDLVRGI